MNMETISASDQLQRQSKLRAKKHSSQYELEPIRSHSCHKQESLHLRTKQQVTVFKQHPPVPFLSAPPLLGDPAASSERYSCSRASTAPHARSLTTSSADVTKRSSCESCSSSSSACAGGSLAAARSMVTRRVRRLESNGVMTRVGSVGAAKRWMTDSRRRLRAMGDTGGSTEMRVVKASRARLCKGRRDSAVSG